MARLRPGWFVVLCATALLVSAWLPWLTTLADGGGRATAIGGRYGQIGVPPNGFGVGQLVVLLSSALIVAAAMAARGLSARIASTAALTISILIGVMVAFYHRLYVAEPVTAGVGFYVAGAVTAVAIVMSVLTMVVAWSRAGRR